MKKNIKPDNTETEKKIGMIDFWRFVLRYLAKHKAKLAVAVICSITTGIVVAVQPLLIKNIVDEGHGAVIMVPHCGNWYMAAWSMAKYGLPLFAIAARQRNPKLNAWMNRQYGDIEVLDRDCRDTLSQIREKLSAGRAFAILPDLRVRDRDVAAEFFGGKACLGGFESLHREGMTNQGLLHEGTKEEVQAFTKNLIAEFGKKGLLLGADCTIDSAIDHERIRWVVEAAREV